MRLQKTSKIKGFKAKCLLSTVSRPPVAHLSSASADRDQETCKKPWKFNVSGVFSCLKIFDGLSQVFDVSTDYPLMGRDYVNLHSRKRLEGVLQELSGIIVDLQDV